MNNTAKFQTIAFFILLGFVLFIVGKLFLPYASVLMWAAILYILLSPLYTKIISKLNPEKRMFQFTRRLLAAVFSIGTVLILAGVLTFLVLNLYAQGSRLAESILDFFSTYASKLKVNTINSFIKQVQELTNGAVNLSQIDLPSTLAQALTQLSNIMLGYIRLFVVNTGNFLISLVFLSFALYFFYIDGQYLSEVFVRAIPINTADTERLLAKFKDVTMNLFQGLFLVSLYQSIAAFIIFFLFGIESSLLLAILTFFSSFLPLFGCTLIWLPVGIGVTIMNGWGQGLFFLLVAGIGISFMDNFLRPMFLKDRIKIHPLLIFFSILGGVNMFGFNGIILGPIIVILFFTIIDISLEFEDTDNQSLKADIPRKQKDET